MLPVNVIEYTAMVIPAIATRLKTTSYYFVDSMIKFYEPENIHDMAKCIIELYEHPQECLRLAQNAKKFSEKYNWSSQKNSYYNLIDQLTKE